ncbi:DNA replication ATP-dependent helicase dna2, partial [Haematococcus lacustris]
QPLPAWLKQALDPERRVVFLDTADSCHDSCSQEAVSNLGEAQIIARLVQSLLLCGAQPADLGLVSPFRAQRKVAEVQSALALDHPAPSSAAGSAASTPAPGQWSRAACNGPLCPPCASSCGKAECKHFTHCNRHQCSLGLLWRREQQM